MTKVQRNYDLLRPLDEPLMKRVADLHGMFGILRIQPAGDGAHLKVDYDASRLTLDQVEAALHGAGLPIRRVN